MDFEMPEEMFPVLEKAVEILESMVEAHNAGSKRAAAKMMAISEQWGVVAHEETKGFAILSAAYHLATVTFRIAYADAEARYQAN